jgi:hypothetical protein
MCEHLYRFCETVSIQSIWSYSRFCLFCEQCIANVYEDYMFVRPFIDGFTYMQEWFSMVNTGDAEPTANHWITLCTVQNYDQETSHYFETMQIYYQPIRHCDQRVFNESLDCKNTNVSDNIIVMKTDGLYKVRIFAKEDDLVEVIDTTDQLPEVLEPSCFQMLNAFYKHPEMDDSIPLKVPQEMMMVGNQLFSPAFVRRCLEYQSMAFFFDKEYTVEIVDSNIDMHTLKHTNHLLIEKNGAFVK